MGETVKVLEEQKYCFLHIDVDMYQPTWDSLNYFYPKLVSNSIIVCDDYGFSQYSDSAKRAVDEFFQDKKEEVKLLNTKQCLIVKK